MSTPTLGRIVRDDDLASRSEPVDPGNFTVSEQALANSPLFVALIVGVWMAVGLGAAHHLVRRGHDSRSLTAMGLVFGPLMFGYDRLALRPQRRGAAPLVLTEPEALGGATRILIAVLGPPERAADAESLLRLSRSSLAEVMLVAPVSYEVLREPEHPEMTEAIARLGHAAQFLDDVSPGMAVIPGRGIDAVAAHVTEHPVDLLVVTGDPTAHGTLDREHEGRTVSMSMGALDAERPDGPSTR